MQDARLPSIDAATQSERLPVIDAAEDWQLPVIDAASQGAARTSTIAAIQDSVLSSISAATDGNDLLCSDVDAHETRITARFETQAHLGEPVTHHASSHAGPAASLQTPPHSAAPVTHHASSHAGPAASLQTPPYPAAPVTHHAPSHAGPAASLQTPPHAVMPAAHDAAPSSVTGAANPGALETPPRAALPWMQGGPPPATLLTRPPPVRRLEIVALIAIIALADIALYQGAGGAGLAVLFAGIPAILFVSARTRCLSRRFAAISALLALVAVRCLWQSSTGATALGIALLLPFAIALRTMRSFLAELVASALGSAVSSLRELVGFGAALGRLVRPRRLSRVSSAAIYVPAGLVVVFGAIFAAANPVIQGWIQRAFGLIDGNVWTPSLPRILFWLACALAAAGLLRPVISTIAGLDARLGLSHVAAATADSPAALRLALARNGMIALNVLFLGYNALDAVYLWGGRAPSGVSHTEYAHAGTAWLTVAFMLSTIVLGAVFRGPIEHHARGRLARGLAYVWAAQNFILAAGTFRRVAMYIAYSGLTQLRIVGIIGTMLATMGLAIVVYKVARHRTMLWVMRRQLDALAIAVVVFIVAPTDKLAMRYNVARIQADQYRPLLHLYEQPIRDEAVPAILPLLDHADPVVRQGIAVLLAAQHDRLRADDARATSWMDFEIACYQALHALDDAAPHLAAVMPADRPAASAKLRGVAYGINDEYEREGDEAPFDWRTRSYAPRE